MTRVGIVAKPDAPRAKGVISQLLTWLSAQGLGAVLEKETAGGHNVFDDLTTTWADVGWEQAVARKPDVVVINDYGSVTAEQKVVFITGNPALSSLPAVQNKRIVIVPLPGIFESVRAAQQVEAMAKAFYPTLWK